ncbi:hypothetical protein [Streptomyces rubiginosohelvolus]|uniref:hypothetical protein n=1 Tax=Streptomyces rubiginosohelvolus TaxID=67362 RepID=UPI0033ACDDED
MTRSAAPERLTDFVGQDHLLEEAVPQHLRSAAGQRPVVLRGVLGSGATAVANEYLHRTYPRLYVAAEWINFSDNDESSRLVHLALHRFRQLNGPALLVLDGVTCPERLVGLLPDHGPDVLITSAADASVWGHAESVLDVTALPTQDAVRLLRRYQPGMARSEAEQLAARLDHSPAALTQVGQQLSRKLSASHVLELSQMELLALLHRSGTHSPADRIGQAVEALAPDWCFAQDLLRALALIGAPVFPSRNLGPLFLHNPDLMSSSDRLPVALVVEALELLSRRGLIHFHANGSVVLLNLLQLFCLSTVDAPARPRVDRLVEALVIALDIDRGEPAHRADAARAAQHMLELAPDLITTAEGRIALVKLIRVNLKGNRYHRAIAQLTRFREAWGRGDSQVWSAQIDRYLAQAYEGIGNLRKAFACAERAMAAESRLSGNRNRFTLADSYSVARILGTYAPADAIRLAEAVERQQAEELGEQDRETLRTGALIARLQLSCLLPETAADHSRVVWRAQCNALGESDDETLVTLQLLGEALEATGHSAREALACFRDAKKLRRRKFGIDHAATVESTAAYLRVKGSLTPPSPHARDR